MDIERKSFDFDLKADDAAGTVTLYAAVFGNVDRAGEVIAPGAFKNLDAFVRDGWLAVNHDWKELGVATIESAVQDGTGLLLTARFHSTEDAQECRTVVRERTERGKSVKASIGYRVIESATETRDGETVRVLKAVELYEASIVNLPANPLASVASVKGWWSDLDDAYRALKEGRVISTTNRNRLKKCRDRLKETCDDIDTLLMETEPATMDIQGDAPKSADPPSTPSVPPVHAMDLYSQSLAICARYNPR